MPLTLYPSTVKRRTANGTYTDLAASPITAIDSALSASSENPVQNKVVTGRMGTDTLLTTAQSLSGAINEHAGDISRVKEILQNYNSAGLHNSLFRGKNFGATVTADQWSAISAGTFEDLFIGDYWTINSVRWRIAAFDYWLNCGDTQCTTHHVVLVPDTNLHNSVMNSSHTTAGAYVGSGFYSGTNANGTENTGKSSAITKVEAAFGSEHILSHREYFANATTGGYQSAGAWYDSTVDLMNEQMVYGCRVYSNIINGTALPNAYTIDKGQLPLFALAPQYICNRAYWWLRDVVSSTFFAFVGNYGNAYYFHAGYSLGVRPAFGIKA